MDELGAGAAAEPAAVRNRIMRLAWPAVGEMFLITSVWMADTAMVGRLGAEATSAVGFGGDLYFCVISALASLEVAVLAVVARCVGADDRRGARFAAAQALVVACALGLTVAVLGWLLAPAAFRLTGLGPRVQALGGAYLRIMTAGAVFMLPVMVINGVFRGSGDTRTPLFITGAVNALNVAGDYALIYGHWGMPALGVTGAAIASVAAQGVGLALAVWRLMSRGAAAGPGPGWSMRPDRRTVARLARVAAPAGAESLFKDGARMVGLFIAAATGPVAFAAIPITIAAESVSFMPGYGFGIAAGIVAGQQLGARRPDRAYRESLVAVRMGLLMMVLFGLLFIVAPAPLVRLFTSDPRVIAGAATCLRVAGLFQASVAIADVCLGALRGAGETRLPMLVTGLAAWLVRLPLCLVFLLVLRLPIQFYFWAAGLEWSTKAALAAWAFGRRRWLERTV